MNRLAGFLLFVLAGIVLRAGDKLPVASDLLLDDKAAIEVTSNLRQYDNLPKLTGRLASTGSGLVTVLVNRWATEFAAFYPGLELDIRGGGSADGFPDFLEGKTDLLPMSRELSADEIARFRAKYGYEPSRVVVAQDAVGVYVNKANPVPGLTLVQLDAIYSRDAKRGGQRAEFWRDVGVTGPMADERIVRLVLGQTHGTHQLFREVVMLGSDYRFGGNFERLSSSLVQSVGAENEAIGFASVMWATARTRFVPVQAADGSYVLPTYANTVSGRYPLVRPMWVVFNRKPDGTMNPVAREFLRFAVSRRGQRIIALAESYPITVEQQQAAWTALGETATPK